MILLDTGPSPKGWHRLEKFMTCPRKFALQRAVAATGERSPESMATVLGSMCHIGIAHHYAIKGAQQRGGVIVGGQLITDPSALYSPEEALEIVAGTKRGLWLEALDKAQTTIRAYREHYANEQSKVLMVETVLWYRCGVDPDRPDAPLGEGKYDQSGRVDLASMFASGSIHIIDHKTTSRPSNQADYYGRSGQFMLYGHMGHSIFGDAFKGVLLNMIDLGTVSPRFTRPQLPPVPGKYRRFRSDVVYAEDAIAALERRGLKPADWPAHPSEHTCQTRYSACPVAMQCDWGEI